MIPKNVQRTNEIRRLLGLYETAEKYANILEYYTSNSVYSKTTVSDSLV